MSTSFIPFQPNSNVSPPFTSLVTLDSSSYTLVAMWNLYRGDWYISLTDESGNLVVNQPLIGSPPDSDIPLAPGLFTSSQIVYRVSTASFEVSTFTPTVIAGGGFAGLPLPTPANTAIQKGLVAGVAADGSSSVFIPFTNATAAPTSLLVSVTNYDGTDNAIIGSRGVGETTAAGFTVTCEGGQPGTTVAVNYAAFWS